MFEFFLRKFSEFDDVIDFVTLVCMNLYKSSSTFVLNFTVNFILITTNKRKIKRKNCNTYGNLRCCYHLYQKLILVFWYTIAGSSKKTKHK